MYKHPAIIRPFTLLILALALYILIPQYVISSTNLFDNYYEFQINMILANLGQIRDEVDLWTR